MDISANSTARAEAQNRLLTLFSLLDASVVMGDLAGQQTLRRASLTRKARTPQATTQHDTE